MPKSEAILAPVRTALAQTDPDLALYWLRTFDESRLIRTAGFRLIGLKNQGSGIRDRKHGHIV